MNTISERKKTQPFTICCAKCGYYSAPETIHTIAGRDEYAVRHGWLSSGCKLRCPQCRGAHINPQEGE